MNLIDNSLREKIISEIEWRTNEISTFKLLLLHSNLSDEEKRILKRHTIPALYALWEGFIKDAFSHYIDELNSLEISLDDIAPELLTHSIETHYLRNKEYLNEIPKDFKKSIKRIVKFANDFKEDLSKNTLVIPKTLPTESNINYEVVIKILLRFNLAILPEKPFKKKLDDLLNFRNNFAHGDFSIPVKNENIDEFSQLVIDLMSEILLIIIDGFENKTYLSSK
jgi:methyl-accepting chemotaxis protein